MYVLSISESRASPLPDPSFIILLYVKQVEIAAVLYTCIREVPISNLGQITGYYPE
jgi:hypothetical protein